jgi:protein-L-isoaspartate(D-aspartate) O-methyltransferase
LAPGDRVLDIGCASGYSTALLSRLAGSVVGLEEDAELADRAAVNLAAYGQGSCKVVRGPLAAGWPGEGPYDVILLQGATEIVPVGLLEQLKEGGRLVCVLGRGQSARLMVYREIEGDFSGRPVLDAAAPLLPGFSKPQAFVF